MAARDHSMSCKLPSRGLGQNDSADFRTNDVRAVRYREWRLLKAGRVDCHRLQAIGSDTDIDPPLADDTRTSLLFGLDHLVTGGQFKAEILRRLFDGRPTT